MIKTQFTLSVAAIQASVVERFGYHISYTKASKGKRVALTNLFGDFYKSYAKLPHFFGALEQANPGCVVISKTFPGNMRNERNRVTQRRGLCVISDRHPGIMAAFADVYLGRKIQHAYGDNWENQSRRTQLVGAIPFEKWALSHDGGRRYGIMTTNMSEVFNSVLKGARSFPITTFVQLTFYRVNSYFVVRREHGASRLASGEQYTPYVDAKINANVVKAGSHEVVLYDHFQGLFHVKASRGSKKTSSGEEHIVLNYVSMDAHHLGTTVFNPIHNEYEWPPYVGPVIVPVDSMKRVSGGRPKSTRLHNEMGVREVMEHREGRFDPDPLDRSILALQDRHRSQLVDSGQLNQVLTCRQRLWTFMREWEMDPRIRRYVMQSGFYGVYRVGHISLDWPLITSLVERWRPETHTFHLPIGDMTVTLQDVAMILDYLWSWERLHVGRPDFGRPPVPIVVPHVHDDVVDGLHDHLLPDEALSIDPLATGGEYPCLGLITHHHMC
ncbi:Serine/threonine-protein phosphatase 7 long form-like [Vitis vinifera]|uniref:Serine/threonine-protein phosphatase 7 long form-like n=1 Tax=Vitis vinifera TaxID=29760 RepID=A0A438IRP8_VITVI|nr:Serine/threonine-protein phosphatase 7 long form-like [Vitis vinifera]